MSRMIQSLCTLLETGKTPVDLKPLEDQVGDRLVLLTALTLVRWLRSQFDRPLEMKDDSPSSRGIADTISASSDLSSLLEINGNQVRFRDSVPQEQKQEIKDFVRSRPLGRLMASKV